MRTSILLIALTGILAFSPANAGPGKGKGAEYAAACDVLKGTQRGLHGLCVAYCAHRDLSQVDLNDTKSVKAAASSIKILRKYRERKRPYDPEMPCFKNTEPPEPPEPPTEPPTEPPPEPPSNCPCWSGAELAAIDGNLLPGFGEPTKECTTTGTKEQAAEGYLFSGLLSADGLAYGLVEPDQPMYACRYIRTPRSDPDTTLEPQDILYSIERAEAEACMAEIETHCTP